jgi:hypothetical protein
MLVSVAAGVWIAGCGGGGGGDRPAPERPPARAPAPEATATPTPAPIMLGARRYVSPCSVLPLQDVERIYGPLTQRGYVRQEFYDASMSAATFRRETDTATRSLRTVCDYNRGDRKLRSIQVEVEQFRTAKAARAEWASIAYLGTGKESRKLARERAGGDFDFIVKLARENERNMGGDPVRGMKDVLFVRGRADFVGVGGNTVVRLSYLPLGFVTPVLSRRQYTQQAAKARAAFRVILSRLEDPGLSQAPAPVTLGAEREVAGRPYLEPCRALSEQVFHAATGRASTEPVEMESLLKDTAWLRTAADSTYGRSAEASCRRRARYKHRASDLSSHNDFAELSVRVATQPQPDDELRNVGTQLASDWMIATYFNKQDRKRVTAGALIKAGAATLVSKPDTKADALYVVETEPQRGVSRHRTAFFNVGPYAFKLSVTRGTTITRAGSNPGVTGYRRVVDAIATEVLSQQRRGG